MRSREKDPTEPMQPVPESKDGSAKGNGSDSKKITSGAKQGSEDLRDQGHPKIKE